MKRVLIETVVIFSFAVLYANVSFSCVAIEVASGPAEYLRDEVARRFSTHRSRHCESQSA